MIVDFLNKNWIGALIGLIGIIISVIVSFYFYRKAQVKAMPSYQTRTTQIIDTEENIDVDNVEVMYKGQKVNILAKTHLIFWNDGNQTLDGCNIVKSERLRIVYGSDSGQILLANVIKSTRDVNKLHVKVTDDSSSVTIDFDFLDPGDGALIEILHTFKKSKITIEGVIKGIPEGVKYCGMALDIFERSSKKDRLSNPLFITFKIANSKVLRLIYLFIGLFFLYCSIRYNVVPKWLIEPSDTFNRITFAFIGIMFLLPISIISFIPKRKFPKTLMITEEV